MTREVVKTNIVVICFNALSYTKATINSLFSKTKNAYFLTIIDNGSYDDTKKYIDQIKLPTNCVKLTVIRNEHNMGVGHAYNQGFLVSIAKGIEYTCFCNNDLYFSSDWLDKLEAYLDTHPNVAMVNPLRPSTSTIYDGSFSTMDKLMQIKETDKWRGELTHFTEMPVSRFDVFCKKIIKQNCEYYKKEDVVLKFPDALSTCVCLVRNTFINKLTEFADPIFKGYGGEDIDTCWRVMFQGYDCAINREVYVHHFRGKSLKVNGLNRQKLLLASNELLYDRWKDQISQFARNEMVLNVDVESKLAKTTNNEYWLLSQLNRGIDILGEIRNE